MDFTWDHLKPKILAKTYGEAQKQVFGYPWVSKKFHTYPLNLSSVFESHTIPAKVGMLFSRLESFGHKSISLSVVLVWGLPFKFQLA